MTLTELIQQKHWHYQIKLEIMMPKSVGKREANKLYYDAIYAVPKILGGLLLKESSKKTPCSSQEKRAVQTLRRSSKK